MTSVERMKFFFSFFIESKDLFKNELINFSAKLSKLFFVLFFSAEIFSSFEFSVIKIFPLFILFSDSKKLI